jgi:predicted PolB exonuclease-like 3'-5' exonuclease
MLFRVVDIETVPDLMMWTPGEPKWEAHPGLRDEKSAFWFSGQAFQEYTPCKVLYKKVEAFPPPQAQRVVAIAWCDVDMQPTDFKTYRFVRHTTMSKWSHEAEAERFLISLFGKEQCETPATLVTWNGRTFDLPVLALRALHLGIPWSWYYDARDIRYRYTDQGHCDLMDYLSDFGASRSMKLTDACHLVGLPGKTDMDGSQVADIVAQGPNKESQERIARYCLQDALQTALLFVRTRFHLGILTTDEYHASLDTFSSAVQDVLTVDWAKCRIG